jgi:rod shape-determining protein MreC
VEAGPAGDGEGVRARRVGRGQRRTPLTAVPDWFRSRSVDAPEIATLAAQNSDLRHQVVTSDVDRNRLAEYDGLTSAASTLGQALVPARVVGIGASQSFSAP